MASSVSCLESSLLEGSLVVQEAVGSNRVALLKDGDDLGQVLHSTNVCPFFCVCGNTVTSYYFTELQKRSIMYIYVTEPFFFTYSPAILPFLKFFSD
jgi:hypothetical protein